MIFSEHHHPKPKKESTHSDSENTGVSFFESLASALGLCGSVVEYRGKHYRLEYVCGTTCYGAKMLDLTLVEETTGRKIDPVIRADKFYTTAEQIEQAIYRKD